MRCLSTVGLQVQMNGELLLPCRPTRGLSQRDPISPYLFILCREGLSCMLKIYDGGWIEKGILVGVQTPWISHLLFADDCLIFMNADCHHSS